jgi:hypothetical protein
MTYQEALVKAQRGETDQQVLEAFQSAYEEVKRGSDARLINERKTNLAALLLDIANKIGDAGLACFTLRCMPAVARPVVTPFRCAPDTWTAMYLEAEKLSQEVLEVYPRDEAAQSNAVAARNSMTLRSHGVGRVAPEVTARSSPFALSPDRLILFDAALPGGDDDTPFNQTQRVQSDVVEQYRSFYDEEEDGEEDRDQDGDEDDGDDAPLRAMGTANAGSPGSGGSAATSQKDHHLRADGSCSQPAEQRESVLSLLDGSM